MSYKLLILENSDILLQVVSYVMTVPKQRWEFPVLAWGKKVNLDSNIVFSGLIFYNLIHTTIWTNFTYRVTDTRILLSVNFAASCKEEDIIKMVTEILNHVLEPSWDIRYANFEMLNHFWYVDSLELVISENLSACLLSLQCSSFAIRHVQNIWF